MVFLFSIEAPKNHQTHNFKIIFFVKFNCNQSQKIRVDPDAPKIRHRGPILIRHLVPATRRSSLDGPIFCGERLSHALLPTCRLWQLTDCPLAVQRSTPPP